jgi:WD40 repeat protein
MMPARPLLAQQAEETTAQREKPAAAETALAGGAAARLGAPRAVILGHTTAMAASPDNRWLAVAAQNRNNGKSQLSILDAKTGELKRTFTEGQTTYFALGFDNDGKTLHASDQSWSIDTGEKVNRPVEGNLIAISPNGKFWAILRNNDGRIVIWDVANKAEVGALGPRSIPGMAQGAAVTDDGKHLAHSLNNQLHIVEVATAKVLDPITIGQNQVRVLSMPGENRFFAFGYGNRGTIVDAGDGKSVRDFQDEPNSYLTQAAVSSDGKQIACALSRQIIRVWDTTTGDTIKELPTQDYQLQSLVYSSDGQTFYAGAERQGRDNRLFVWKTSNWEEALAQDRVQGPVRRLLYSPDGKWLAADSVLGKVYLWNVAEKRLEKTLTGDALFDLRFSDDGWLLGAAGANGWYAIWEVESGDQLFTGRANPSEYSSIAAFSPQLDRLAVNRSSAELRVVKITSGEAVFETRNQNQPGAYQGQPNALSYSPDGKSLIHTTDYYSPGPGAPPITQLEIATGKTTRPFKADPTPVNPNDGFRRGNRLFRAQWSPDGATVAATDERGEISMWDVRTGDYLHGLARCEIQPAFSPDGNYIAGFSNQTLSIYEVHSGDEIFSASLGEADPNRHQGYIQPNALPEAGLTAAAFSPDGRLFAGAYRNDDTILLWNLVPLDHEELKALAAASVSEYEQWWATLAGDSPKAAHSAMWRFALAGDGAIAYLKDHIGKAAESTGQPERIKQLIAELDADQLATRKAAAQSLRELGQAALPALEEALKANASAEVRRAIAAIKTSPMGDRMAGDPLRRLRAIVALERNGSARAADVLVELAKGADDKRETWFARSALGRVKSRGSKD